MRSGYRRGPRRIYPERAGRGIATYLWSRGCRLRPHQLNPEDDYPDFIISMAWAVAEAEVERGVALCGSGVGASIAANKVPGVRAALIHDVFSAHHGVEDNDMNVFCLGGKVIGSALACELIETFLAARFHGAIPRAPPRQSPGTGEPANWVMKLRESTPRAQVATLTIVSSRRIVFARRRSALGLSTIATGLAVGM